MLDSRPLSRPNRTSSKGVRGGEGRARQVRAPLPPKLPPDELGQAKNNWDRTAPRLPNTTIEHSVTGRYEPVSQLKNFKTRALNHSATLPAQRSLINGGWRLLVFLPKQVGVNP
jgi:hypothetical protein